MSKSRLSLGVYIFSTLLIMLLIFAFSSQEATASRELSESILYKIPLYFRVEINEEALMEHYKVLIRKLAHFVLYFALGASSFMMFSEAERFRKSRLSAGGSAFVFSVSYAASDELHQYFVPGRSMQIADILLDSAGALTAILFLSTVIKLVFKRREERMEYEQASSTKKE